MNLFGRRGATDTAPSQASADEQALARYRYMLQTAPPEDIERAHEEAFARLTPDQRRQALAALAQVVPPSEIRGDDPASLARTATRAEVRQPGTIERVWGGAGAGPGLGTWFLATLAASFVGTVAAQAFFDSNPGVEAIGETAEASDTGAIDEADASGEFGEGDFAGDPGGDFGGGDFGGI